MPTTEAEPQDPNHPAALIDHTLLRPDSREEEIDQLCEEAVEHGFAAACVPPAFVSRTAEKLYGSGVKVCSVIGFPCGYVSIQQKITETQELIASGAEELDMVIHLAPLLEGRLAQVGEEIAQVVLAAQTAPVKVIIECCYLTAEQMRQATEQVVLAGAAFVKTSTGFAPVGARVEDVQLLAEVAAGRIGIKAAGGIRDLAGFRQMVAAGATRIGTSSGVTILRQWQDQRWNFGQADV